MSWLGDRKKQEEHVSGPRLRVGVVGVGHLGRHHARIYHEIPDVELVGVADTNERIAREIARKHRTQAFTDARQLHGLVDAVSIAVPTKAHCEVCVPFLEQKVHVLVEKPISSTLEEADEMLEAARKSHVVLQVGHIERFIPAIVALKEILTEPRFIEVHRLAPFNPRGTDVGVVLDLMIHDLDVVLSVVKAPVSRLESVGVDVLTDHEDIANTRINFRDGCIANITASRVSFKRMRKIRIFQHNTYISLDYGKQEGLVFEKSGNDIQCRELPMARHEPLKSELAAFVQCIRSGQAPLVGGEEAREALRVAMEVADQIAARRKVEYQKLQEAKS